MIRGTLRAVGGLNTVQRGRRACYLLICLLLFVVYHPILGGQALSSDGLSLLEFKNSITCDNSHEALPDWDGNDAHPCRWFGVTCDPTSQRVVGLKIVGRRTYGHYHAGKGSSEGTFSSITPKSYCSLDGVEGHPMDDGESCELLGTLSPAIGKLSQLAFISIAFNRISGEIPKDIAQLTLLHTLDLRHNLLTGDIPSEIGKLSNLRVLQLDHNAFEGRIPAELSSCHQLRRLSLGGNMLSGSIPISLGRLPRLKTLSLYNNRLVGSIPIELGLGGWRDLILLDLSGNELSGNIPSELGGCSRLKRLLLNFNFLVGSIPVELGQLRKLKSLQVAGNYLSGVVPSRLARLSRLEDLILTNDRACSTCLNRSEGNSFHGVLPPGVSSLPSLRVLWAPDAGLSGLLPTGWGRCDKLESVNLARNAFTGSLSSGLSSCKRLGFLDLSANQLTGGIPQDFTPECMSFFDVSKNAVVGKLPGLFKDCSSSRPRLTRDFSFSWVNNFTVCFAFQARGSSMCKVDNAQRGFSVDSLGSQQDRVFNDLTSEVIPSLSLRRSVLENAATYNETPIGVAAPFSSQHELYEQNNRKLNSILVAAITSGCAIAIVLFVLGLMFQCTRQRSPTGPAPQPGRRVVVTFMNINHHLTYENVVRATGNFSIDNLIGSGGFGATYKAEVKPGLLVAVKRLAIGRFQGVQQFDTEIRTLGRIRHPNLVTLIGYHASNEEMFLIYNFFSQGNLETLIHSERDEMDWRTRHNIALRIAEALAYLHDDCVPRVLHRDIKPSNILLDENLNAHLSDFGLARLLGASETHATTDVAGTFGYVAPEYAMTCRVTDKADVYSYGVVLLELLSGKRALDPSFCEFGDGFNIVSWACLLIRKGRPNEVFTVRLWELGPEDHLLEALKLAVLCTVDQLSTRPTMKEVVDTLRKIRPMASIT